MWYNEENHEVIGEMFMFYSTKQFCQLSGITINTLRYYLENGLIEPANIQANGYRQFSLENVIDVFMIRNQRGIDTSVDELKAKMSKTLPEQLAYLNQHLIDLNEEKRHLELKIQRTEYFIKLLNCPMNVKCSEYSEITDGLYLLRLEQDIEKIHSIIENWSKYPELVFVCFFISYQKVVKGEMIHPSVGIGIRGQNVERMHLKISEVVEHYDLSKELQFVGKTSDPFHIPYDDLRLFFEDVKRRNLRCDQEFILRITTVAMEDGKRVYYFTLSAHFD